VDGGVSDFNPGFFEPAGLDASADPYGDPANLEPAGFDAASDPYGDPGADTGFDSFDGGDFGNDF
jgi:hypothetical protein